MDSEDLQNTEEEDTTTEINNEENNEKETVDNEIELTEENNNDEEKEDDEDQEEMEEDSTEVDSGGWITPGNIKKVKRDMGYNDEIDIEGANVQCACLTTDFAMQVYLIFYLFVSFRLYVCNAYPYFHKLP